MKLAEWARASGVHPQTAYRWFREGRMPVPARRLESGTIWVDAAASGEAGRTVVYARVSSHDQRADLDRQVARLTDWATSNGHVVGEVVTEVGSGLNGKRPKLRRVLSDPSASVVVVEHRDRLARFGVEYLEAALSAQGRKVVVTDQGETADDLVRDMIEVLTSMCARLYGRRGARNRAMRAVTATKQAEVVGGG
ncbi:IS607 family transposase [Mycolicibacterium frederiksbergense]|uniref:IS607 family transposase n=1 Tax=Mycolicibacterium frederiksbergense TaxID=117567 RepID=A0A6H0RZW9_9MYCO|nr:IS607 family transposase [Mycolicibacterium frederiksbergense]QIV79615.1 IS607 family transposase [Mycolicibacterium frederiksbergense]